jgi:hypothetical protein
MDFGENETSGTPDDLKNTRDRSHTTVHSHDGGIILLPTVLPPLSNLELRELPDKNHGVHSLSMAEQGLRSAARN